MVRDPADRRPPATPAAGTVAGALSGVTPRPALARASLLQRTAPAPGAGTALERLAARHATAPGVLPVRPTTPGTPSRPLAPVPVRPAAPAGPATSIRPAVPTTRPMVPAKPPIARAVPALPVPLPTHAEIEATVDHESYERFAASIRVLLGFDLTQYKRPQVWRRSNAFARQKGCADVHELVARARTDLELRTSLRDMITINVSEFFRNPEAWEALLTTALPELLRQGRPIRFWSAGCSLGFEPYTFAMLVAEAGGGAEARIQATDLDETILAQARASAYAEHQMVGLSAARRARFFDQHGALAVVKPELRRLVQWRRHDLLRDPFPAEQDLVACRNVVIYFTDEAKAGLYQRFARSLRLGGVLFIGATEAIATPQGYGLRMTGNGIYRRIA